MLGEIKATLTLKGFDMWVSNPSAPAVYGSAKDGRVFCIRAKGAPRLTLR